MVKDLTLNGLRLASVTIEFKLNADDFEDVLAKLTEGQCKELCRGCGVFRCIGDDPHAERFGPFHVFPQHDCQSEAL